MKGKETAKFFAGLAANQCMTHAALAIGGVQITLFGIPYTSAVNTTAAIVWEIVSILLILYAWAVP